MRVYCGDLNIHIGELIDFLLNDDLDRYKECVDHVDNPIISNRRSMNKAVNAVGRKLPQMCFDTGLTVDFATTEMVILLFVQIKGDV